MRFTLLVVLGGLAVAAIVFALSGGHLVFLPLLLFLPLGVFGFGRRRR